MTDQFYPIGLEDAILFILSYHHGRKRAIGRSGLVWVLKQQGHSVGERPMRECIKQLRRQGHLICSMPGEDGGYYLAETLAEFQKFDQEEFGAKIADMNETRQALLKAARQQFGEAVQMELI
jgi:hypothetical protein